MSCVHFEGGCEMRFKKSFPSKICPCCGNEFFKRETESKLRWVSRKYCGAKCGKLKFPMKEYKQERLKYILSNISITKSGCMEWKGCIHKSGYGIISFLNKQEHVHRIVYQIIHGEIPKEMFVCHHCDNPKCVNIDHLFLGTPQDNMTDMINKGRDNKFCKLSDQDKKNIVKMAQQGISYSRIADKFKIDRTTANDIAVNNGIRRMPIRM